MIELFLHFPLRQLLQQNTPKNKLFFLMFIVEDFFIDQGPHDLKIKPISLGIGRVEKEGSEILLVINVRDC